MRQLVGIEQQVVFNRILGIRARIGQGKCLVHMCRVPFFAVCVFPV